MASPAETIGAAGYFLSAVLETAGSIALSDILVSWEGFFEAAGVLLFLISCAVAIRELVDGEPTRPLWLFLGPILLCAVLWTTSPMTPPEEITFQEKTLTDSVKKMVREYEPNNTYRIPLFFDVTNRVSESVVDALTGMLGNAENKAAFQAAARDRVFTQVLLAKGEDREFLELLALSLMGDCADMLLLAKELSEPRLRYAVPNSAAAAEVAAKRAKLDYYREKRLGISPQVLRYLNSAGIEARQDPTCEETWQYASGVSLKVVQKLLDLRGPVRQQYLNFTDDEWLEIIEEIEFRLGVRTNDPMMRAQGLRMLAGIFLHNSMNSATLSSFLTLQRGRQTWMFPGQERLDPDKGDALLSELRNMSTRFAASVPYVQGMLLYLLSIGFPFFVLVSLLPTRAGTLFLWISLWFWVKSWTVGYALIWAIRDILYQTLPSLDQLTLGRPVAEIDWNDPSTIFFFVSAEEPLLQVNAYQSTIAILVICVPALTAYLFRGASDLLRIASNGLANSDGLQRRRYRGDDNQKSMLQANKQAAG